MTYIQLIADGSQWADGGGIVRDPMDAGLVPVIGLPGFSQGRIIQDGDPIYSFNGDTVGNLSGSGIWNWSQSQRAKLHIHPLIADPPDASYASDVLLSQVSHSSGEFTAIYSATVDPVAQAAFDAASEASRRADAVAYLRSTTATRILERFPIYRQTNYIEILTRYKLIVIGGGGTLTADQLATQTYLESVVAWKDAMVANHNVLEASILSGASPDVESGWPAFPEAADVVTASIAG